MLLLLITHSPGIVRCVDIACRLIYNHAIGNGTSTRFFTVYTRAPNDLSEPTDAAAQMSTTIRQAMSECPRVTVYGCSPSHFIARMNDTLFRDGDCRVSIHESSWGQNATTSASPLECIKEQMHGWLNDSDCSTALSWPFILLISTAVFIVLIVSSLAIYTYSRRETDTLEREIEYSDSEEEDDDEPDDGQRVLLEV